MTTNLTAPRDVRTTERAPAAPQPVGADPMLLGAPATVLGALGLGLFFFGFRSADNSLAGPLPIMVFSGGVGLLIATSWAMRRGEGPIAAMFALFGAFWLSLAALTLGLTNSWFGPLDMQGWTDATINFMLIWFVALLMLTFTSLRLPKVYTLMYVVIDLALLLTAVATVTASGVILGLGALALLVFVALGIYLFAGAMNVATGGKPFPMGSPIMKR
jgi:succinate-acetate transporter protein